MGERALNSAAETFRFQISTALPQHLLVAWFDQAAAGERIVYCEGYVPLRDDAAWKLAGAWARAGLVHLVTERAGAQTRWIAEKSGKAAVSVKPAPERSTSELLVDIQLAALLDLLRAAAASGERCPTKTVLAREVTGQTDQRARNRVTYLRKRLAAEGKITVIAGRHNQAPVVTILAKGKGCGCSTLADKMGEG